MNYKRAYIEINNTCNLSCEFCVGNTRKKQYISLEQFEYEVSRVSKLTPYIYLHILGEPLLHPQLKDILDICSKYCTYVHIVTNGTLINQQLSTLLGATCIRKIKVSLNSLAYSNVELTDYVNGVIELINRGAFIVELKLFAEDELNNKVLALIGSKLGMDIVLKDKPFEVSKRVYISYSQRFFWPIEAKGNSSQCNCLALREQFAVLVDGSVTACCLDSDGQINLGNMLTQELSEILNCKRANEIRQGFRNGRAIEKLCKGCHYATRFNKV